ncbi:MAG: hypothetical protein U0230_28455 [Polyangiales bacterium]
MSASKVPSRRPPARPSIPRVDDRAESAPALRPEAVGRRAVGLVSNAAIASLEAELAREKAGRAADADQMGEMLVRVAAAENDRRRAELAADALAERVGSLEIELRVVRERLETQKKKASVRPVPGVAEAEARAHAAEARALEFGARTADAEAARDRALSEIDVLHAENDALRARVAELEDALVAAESALEDARTSARAASDRAAHVGLELEAMAREAADARTSRDAMHDELARLREDVQRSHAERDEAIADAEAAGLSRGRHEREVAGLGESLAAAEQRLETASIELERERALRAEAEERLARIETELGGLAGELARARAEAQAATRASDETSRAAAEREAAMVRTRALLAELEDRDRRVGVLRQKALEQALAWLGEGATPESPAPASEAPLAAAPGIGETEAPDETRTSARPTEAPSDLALDFSDIDVDSLS